MFGYLATECGWDFNFISRTLTLSQIRRYYEVINDNRLHQLGMLFQGVMVSTAAGQGNIKMDKFSDFLDQFFKKSKQKIDANKTFDSMKSGGLPVEDN